MSGMRPFNWREIESIFLASRPSTCPYLPDQIEQKLVTLLPQGDSASFAQLTACGFRRSHDVAYHPACPSCTACKALRVRVAEFKPSKTQRRLRNRYAGLKLQLGPAHIDGAHWSLFRAYVRGRHDGGSMAEMTRQDFATLVADSPVDTRLLAWHNGSEGPLLAACLVDLLPQGLSAVYSYFSLDPQYPSLGTYIILALIDLAARAELDEVHLGYWVEGAKKMAYKARFGPAEICVDGRWKPLPKPPSKS